MTSRKRLVFSYCSLSLLLTVLFAVSLFWGSVALTPQAVLAALTGRGQDALSVGIIIQLRLPRAVMAALLGAALSAAGYLLQTFFANPIAGPFVMGISSGAKLAVALVMVLFLNYGLLTSSAVLILAAFAGAMAAMAFVLAAARRVQRMSILVICGVMIGYICSAITEYRGGLCAGQQHRQPAQLVAGQLFRRDVGQCAARRRWWCCLRWRRPFCLAKPMAAYQMGEAYARSVGVNVQAAFSAALVLLSSLLAACVTAFAGPISFVGIAVPHLVKQLLGSAKPAVCAAGVLLGRCGFLPVVRPAGPQSVRAHGAVHQLGHGRVRRAGGHLGCWCAATGRMRDERTLCVRSTAALPSATARAAACARIFALGALPRGRCWHSIGPNGAGKSTLLQNVGGPAGPFGRRGAAGRAGACPPSPATPRAQKLALMAAPHPPHRVDHLL